MWKKKPINVKMFSGASVCATVTEKKNVNGVTMVSLAHKPLDEAYPPLPDSKNFNLQAQLDAGVKLKEVNTRLLADDVNDVELPVPESKTE